MRALAGCLKTYVEQHFRSALSREPDASIRPVLIGPPDDALSEMFALLTAAGQREWQLAIEGSTREIVVLLVDVNAPPSGTGLSQGCHWDYAVTVRNSRPLVLILAARRSWDNRPESLSNTTETLGELGASARRHENPLQAHLVATVASQLGLQEPQTRELVRLVRAESENLEPSARDAMSWEVLESLLATAPGTAPADAACRAAGFPVISSSSMGFREAYEVLQHLGQFVASVGLGEAIEQMKGTTAAQTSGVVGSLDSLRNHLAANLFSPTLLQTAPSRYYRVPAPIPSWYDTLTAQVIADILAELNQVQPQDRLALACTNALANARPLRGGPFVVASSADLQASTNSGGPLGAVTFTRKVDRTAPSALAALPSDPLRATDQGVPTHLKPIKYKVEALNHRPGSINILVLDSFSCGGLVVAREAEANGVPVHAARGGTWKQGLILTRGGATELSVLHGSRAARVTVTQVGEPPVVQAVQPGAHSVPLSLELENNDTLQVEVNDSAGTSLGEWAVQITIRDIADVANSRLEALIREHRTHRKYVPHAPDTPLHRLELGSYLQSAESWRPVLACWSDRVSGRIAVDWNSGAFLGNVQPQIDPRRTINPPADVLSAREAVRTILHREQRCLSEIDVNTPTLIVGISDYLRVYRDWLARDPQAACWLDVLTIHTADWNAQAGRHVATEEPVVILLSVLHPLRLAWHAVAQRQLADSLPHPCPGAGLISPSNCPDAGLLYLWDGQVPRPRAFFSLPCEHPHWAVLANTAFLDRQVPRAAAMQRLAELGLQVQAITGGFTAQQTQDSLVEVNRLLPARATLRVGIVGDAETSSECGKGVFRWSEIQQAEDGANPVGCLQVEVFDTRGAADPSPEELAGLSETTAERVRWFKLRPDANVPKLDLTIIDQLGIRSHEAITGSTRSAMAPGCLYRIRLREDFQDARAIVESRVGKTRLAGADLGSLLASTIQEYEELASQDAQHSHFRFIPNQEAMGSRLHNAIFLSVTSSQIDPACIVRGAVGQRGYLWDYELPGVLGGGESSLGYYLVAQPTTAMCNAVERAASLVASPPPNIPGLLEEISRHGIPILKRLASGGSQSRGELGLLLATRLLQDAFRAHAGVARLPVWAGSCIHFVLPVDPYEELFNHLRRALLGPSAAAQRPDLVVVAVQFPAPGQPVAIKLTPVEVKYRAGGMVTTDMRDALTQAQSLGSLLQALWIQSPPSDLWKTCASALLAQFLDFGFRIYAATWLHAHTHEEWSAVHQQVMEDVLEGTARTTVNAAGRLIVFDGSVTTRVADLDGDQRQDTVIISTDDARSLLSVSPPISAAADSAVAMLDFSFPGCGLADQRAGTTRQATHPPTSLASSAAQSGSWDGQRTTSTTETEPVGDFASAPAGSAPSQSAQPSAGPLVSQGSRVPPEARQQVREAFEGFIGNEPAVSRLSNDLLRALIEQPPHLAKNYLFTGLPSTGKTELARRMARALRLPFIKLDGRGVSGRDKLFELVNGELASNNLAASQVGQQVGLPVLEYPPLIVFIDEVHLVPRALQESLLTMLEAADRTVVLSDHVARVHRATFLFATTRASDVDAAFVSRCDEIQLREYTEFEVAQILQWKLRHDDWQDPTYEALARLGRCVPRIAIQLAGALETTILVSEREKPVAEHLDEVRRAREIDARGLTRMDFEYLAILEKSNNPVGEQNILNLMRTVDKDRILNEVEPFLVRLGFILHGPRGRELTSEGREYLLAHRARGGM